MSSQFLSFVICLYVTNLAVVLNSIFFCSYHVFYIVLPTCKRTMTPHSVQEIPTKILSMGGSRKFRPGGGGGGPDNIFFLLFLDISVFHRGSYGPPTRSNWTLWV